MTALVVTGTAVAVLLWLSALARIVLVAARMYQIEEYEAGRLWAWANVPAWNWHRALVAAAACSLAGGIGAVATKDIRPVIAGAVAAGISLHLLWRWIPPKKALVMTPRARRLLATTAVLAVAITGLVIFAGVQNERWAAFAVWVLAFMATSFAVILLLLANLLMSPVEASIRGGFVKRARQRLLAVDPVVVGVAGSWGKTSTKHILAALLPVDAAALPTPKSFNTLMGVTRTINDNLGDEHKTFIVEMDAYGPGEIASICDLVHPRIAVITAVGPQHLERFRSIEAIGDALYETVAALPADGSALFHAGDSRCAALAARSRADGRRTVTYAMESEAVDADVMGTDVTTDAGGSRFTWRWAAENLEVKVSTPLLGGHQVLNISAALATVHLLGHDVTAAAARAAALQPVEHRLQPLPSPGGVIVIDDSYNANPVGVHSGLEVLASLGDGKRILVTPGLVELGSEEVAENRLYGEHAARVCDHVIVMRAKTTDALVDGLHHGGLDDAKVHVVNSLAEATAVIGTLAVRGDVVLFANDLPDTYLDA